MRGYSLFANPILTLVKENFNSVTVLLHRTSLEEPATLQSEGNSEGNID